RLDGQEQLLAAIGIGDGLLQRERAKGRRLVVGRHAEPRPLQRLARRLGGLQLSGGHGGWGGARPRPPPVAAWPPGGGGAGVRAFASADRAASRAFLSAVARVDSSPAPAVTRPISVASSSGVAGDAAPLKSDGSSGRLF